MSDQAKEWQAAYGELMSMRCDSPMKSYPTSYVHPKQVRGAAQIMRKEILRLQSELATLRTVQQWRGIESAPRDGTPIEVRVNWLWNGGRGDEVELIDIAHFDSSVSNWVFVTAPNYFQQLDRRCTITLWRPLQAHTVTGDKQ